jgi:hypothetical protein
MGCVEVLDERDGKCGREEVSFFVWPVLCLYLLFCGILFFGVEDMRKRHDRRYLIAYVFNHSILTPVWLRVRS